MSFFNCFRYYHGLQFETLLPACPTWLCPKDDVPASLAVRFVWCAADLFIVQPLGFIADAAAAFTFCNGAQLFLAQMAAGLLVAYCVYGRAANIVKSLTDEMGRSVLA